MHRSPNKIDMFRVSSLELELGDVYEDDNEEQDLKLDVPADVSEARSDINPLKSQTFELNESIPELRPQNTNLKNLSERLIDATEEIVDQRLNTSASLLNMIDYTKKLTYRIETKPSMVDCTLKCNSSDMLVKNESESLVDFELLQKKLEEVQQGNSQPPDKLVSEKYEDEAHLIDDGIDGKQDSRALKILENENTNITENEETHEEKSEIKLQTSPTPGLNESDESHGQNIDIKDIVDPLLHAIKHQAIKYVDTRSSTEKTKDLSQQTESINFNEDCICKESDTFTMQVAVFDIETQTSFLSETKPVLDDEDGYLKLANFPEYDLSTVTSTAWIDENASFVVTQEPSVHIRSPLGFRTQIRQVEQVSSAIVTALESQPEPEKKESKMRRCKCFMQRLSKIFKSNEL